MPKKAQDKKPKNNNSIIYTIKIINLPNTPKLYSIKIADLTKKNYPMDNMYAFCYIKEVTLNFRKYWLIKIFWSWTLFLHLVHEEDRMVNVCAQHRRSCQNLHQCKKWWLSQVHTYFLYISDHNYIRYFILLYKKAITMEQESYQTMTITLWPSSQELHFLHFWFFTYYGKHIITDKSIKKRRIIQLWNLKNFV